MLQAAREQEEVLRQAAVDRMFKAVMFAGSVVVSGAYSANALSASLPGGASALKFGVDDLVYGPSAGGALRKLQEQAGGRLLTDVSGPAAGQSWIQFSIKTIEQQLAAGGKIRFDLTNVQDLPGVLRGAGKYANTVTAQELRYIQSNWCRFQQNVRFYRNGVEVGAPW